MFLGLPETTITCRFDVSGTIALDQPKNISVTESISFTLERKVKSGAFSEVAE